MHECSLWGRSSTSMSRYAEERFTKHARVQVAFDMSLMDVSDAMEKIKDLIWNEVNFPRLPCAAASSPCSVHLQAKLSCLNHFTTIISFRNTNGTGLRSSHNIKSVDVCRYATCNSLLFWVPWLPCIVSFLLFLIKHCQCSVLNKDLHAVC